MRTLGAWGNGSVVERRTRDRKVAGSIHGESGWIFFFFLILFFIEK